MIKIFMGKTSVFVQTENQEEGNNEDTVQNF